MSRRPAALPLVMALAVALAVSSTLPRGSAAATPPVEGRATSPAGALAAKLDAAGRAIVTFERTALDPFAGKTVVDPGTLVLESRFADVRFTRTGERLTVRPDGGEWLQPQLSQMVTLKAGAVAVARHWWEVLRSGGANGASVVREAENRLLVVGPASAGVADTARIILDRGGMPLRLEIVDGTGRSVFRFGRWRFEKARGRAAFVQHAPRGVEVVPFE